MDTYIFMADLMSTYRSNPDWLKFFWIFFPTLLLLAAGSGLGRLIHALLAAREARTARAAAARPAEGAEPPDMLPPPVEGNVSAEEERDKRREQ